MSKGLKVAMVVIIALCAMYLWSYLVPMGPHSVSKTDAVTWEYSSEEFDVDLPSSYIQFPIPRVGLPMRANTFIVEDCAAQSIADFVESRYQGDDDSIKAYLVCRVVHSNLTYIDDCIDYWKYPWETVRDGGGDCEDFAILICSVLKCMGVESVMLMEPGHATIGIFVESGTVDDAVCYLGKEYIAYNSTTVHRFTEGEFTPYIVVGYELNLWNWAEIVLYGGLILICLYAIARKES